MIGTPGSPRGGAGNRAERRAVAAQRPKAQRNQEKQAKDAAKQAKEKLRYQLQDVSAAKPSPTILFDRTAAWQAVTEVFESLGQMIASDDTPDEPATPEEIARTEALLKSTKDVFDCSYRNEDCDSAKIGSLKGKLVLISEVHRTDYVKHAIEAINSCRVGDERFLIATEGTPEYCDDLPKDRCVSVDDEVARTKLSNLLEDVQDAMLGVIGYVYQKSERKEGDALLAKVDTNLYEAKTILNSKLRVFALNKGLDKFPKAQQKVVSQRIDAFLTAQERFNSALEAWNKPREQVMARNLETLVQDHPNDKPVFGILGGLHVENAKIELEKRGEIFDQTIFMRLPESELNKHGGKKGRQRKDEL
jgi:hypothetical protein